MAAHVEVLSGPFYHGTKADLKPGDLISPGYRSNYGHIGRGSPWVYMTATLSPLGAELARGEGPGRLYVVEPTGPFEDDPDLTDKRFPGNPTRSYRSRFPLRVVGEVTDWQPTAPERLQAMREGQERLYALQAQRIARIPGAVQIDQAHAGAEALAAAGPPALQVLGLMVLMRIQGAEVEVGSALLVRSPAEGGVGILELPQSAGASLPSPDRASNAERWPLRDLPMSGRLTDVSAWREGWAAVIECCVTEIGLSLETRIWVAVDADHDTVVFRVDADGPERSWQRTLTMERGLLSDSEHGQIWDFLADPARAVQTQ